MPVTEAVINFSIKFITLGMVITHVLHMLDVWCFMLLCNMDGDSNPILCFSHKYFRFDPAY